MKIIAYISIFISFAALLPAQTINVDSLRQVARNNSLDEKTRTYAYLPIITHFRRSNQDSVKFYMQELLDFAEETDYQIAYHKYHYLISGYNGIYLEPDENAYPFIQKNLLEAKRYAELSNRLGLVSLTYTRLIPENFRFGKQELALQYCFEGEKVAIASEYWQDLAYFYGQLGKIYNLGFGDTDKALTYLLKSDSVYSSLPQKEKYWGFTLSFIGDVYNKLGEQDKNEAYQLRALELFTEAKDGYQQAYIKGKLANIAKRQGNYTKALKLVGESLDFYRSYNDALQVAGFLAVQSDIYAASGQYENAVKAGEEAILLNKQQGSTLGLIQAQLNLAEILSELERYKASNALAKEAVASSVDQEYYEELERLYKVLIRNAEKQKTYQNAFIFTKRLQIVNDTLKARENLKVTKDLVAKYQSDQKEKEIALLTSEKQLAEAKRKNQKTLLWAIVGFSVVALSTLFVLYRNRKRTNDRLRQLDLAKTSFFQNISHEFKTPLSLILGTLEKKQELVETPSERKDLDLMHRHADRLDDLVNQILALSKLQANEWQLKVSETNITPLLKSITAAFNYKAREKCINYNVTIDDIENGWFDVDAIEKITSNLLSNAVKYTPEGGTINFSARQDDDDFKLLVSNTSKAFTAPQLNAIFDRFSRFDDNNQGTGTGIGLALVKQLINLCKGKISVSNPDADKLQFHVNLPCNKEVFEEHQIISQEPNSFPSTVQIETELNTDDDSPILLIIDDNDDIRAFIADSFGKDFKLLEAKNGNVGKELAVETIPDIIISDIMMPGVSGIELCKDLKADERTSHIPIVLFTAKGDTDTELEGINSGADDFIEKPFKLKLLKSRITNLVNSRLTLRKHYRKEVVLTPKDISINSADERFIKRIKAILDETISDESFSSDAFSKAMGMSRMQLHRKLKALTGLSTSEFLRTERLKVAIVLLKDQSLNISEIAYQVGFTSPSYFSKCFKETYGVLPTEYRIKS